MKKTIFKLLGLKTAPTSNKAGKPAAAARPGKTSDSRDAQHTIEDNSDNGTRRQLVQVLLREGVRQHGIPPGWLECQMLVVNSRSRGPGMHVRLVMRQWDQRLLTYALAFQNDLMAAISRFEPKATTWLHGVSWEFNVGDTCPYPEMPEPMFWRGAAAAPAAEPAVAQADPATPTAAAEAKAAPVPAEGADDEVLRDLKDLQSMFAARDASHEKQAAAGGQADFQPTQPSRLD
ncbi:hypothetical protein [Polaromonas sp. A23]|uniref:hypothetical protein n=1 Tax=Polaromonas sp. A23 TaxID=1944133 RepID=UPI0009859F2A|nr:hypothetical protein [Polaromonas sp. A23]OOG38485.1 hypothetical protein B0B52_16535 [Polaromonas sp. A23]